MHLHRYWDEIPQTYRYNRLLQRHEELYESWDCSTEAFEGIRAQDVLPLLLERFVFRVFIAYANLIDVFMDRCFGHNFDASAAWDRNFIDRVQEFDEAAILAGELTPDARRHDARPKRRAPLPPGISPGTLRAQTTLNLEDRVDVFVGDDRSVRYVSGLGAVLSKEWLNRRSANRRLP